MPKVSTYRLEIYRLFQMEFDSEEAQETDDSNFLRFLQKQRGRSAFYASVQRITFPFRAEHTVFDERSPGTSRSEGLESLPTLPTLIKGTTGACIEACPWLRFKKGENGYPFYLWDVAGGRTVVVNELEDLPEYICISHTWGRWLDEEKPALSMPNVPWLVPQNTRFLVEDLPARLEITFPGQYIWFDLFCIPQDRSERALIEISRQAQIFGNAMVVVAWLNDINDWTGLRRTIMWLSTYCLQNYGGHGEILPEIEEGLRTGLVLDEGPRDDEYSSTPCGWLTSLWTLQEACLRPDMALCSVDFELLTVGKDTVVT